MNTKQVTAAVEQGIVLATQQLEELTSRPGSADALRQSVLRQPTGLRKLDVLFVAHIEAADEAADVLGFDLTGGLFVAFQDGWRQHMAAFVAQDDDKIYTELNNPSL
jgi:hypothetical protein